MHCQCLVFLQDRGQLQENKREIISIFDETDDTQRITQGGESWIRQWFCEWVR